MSFGGHLIEWVEEVKLMSFGMNVNIMIHKSRVDLRL